MKHMRVIGLSALLAVLVAAGCGKKADEAKSGDPPKQAEASSPVPAPAPTPAPAAKPADAVSDDLLAYQLGKEMGWVEVYTMMNKASQGDEDFAKVQALARLLGISPPGRMTSGSHPENTVAAELFDSKSKSAGGYFGLGMSLIRAEFGAMLGGVDISEHLRTIELVAGKLHIPEGLWKESLERVKAHPSGKDAGREIDAINKDIEQYVTRAG